MEEYKPYQQKDFKVPELTNDVKEKLEQLKKKLEKFKKDVLKDCENILGISLLPPSRPEKSEEKKEKPNKDAINILIITDDFDKKESFEVHEKNIKKINKIASEIDKNISAEIMDIAEVREACFDGKYEVLQSIAISAPLYDPKDILAALKISEVHKTMAIKKFEKYIVSYIAVGSLFRGDATSHDIDVYVVVDDTDVKRMSRAELKDKLGAIIRGMGAEASKLTGVQKAFHIQTYILTDFWDSVKDANPIIFTFLRDGVPLYDRGVFMPWKLLLKMGRIRPSQEAIEFQMDIGEKLIERTKGKMLSVVGEDLYYAILNPAQAALMLYGLAPPTPKETIQLLDEIFVKKEKLLEKKYVDILEKVRKYYKDIEYGKLKEVSGKDIDDLIKDANDYLKRIRKLFDQIEKKRSKETFGEVLKDYEMLLKDSLEVNKVKFNSNYLPLFKKEMVDKKVMPEFVLTTFKNLEKIKENFAKTSIQELEKIKRESRTSMKILMDYIQRKRGYELERAKVRFKYGDKFGEVTLLDDVAFIIKDLDAKEKEVQKAKITKDGSLTSVEKSNLAEYDDKITKVKLPGRVFIKEKTFESLKSLFGRDIEILVNY